MKSDLMLTASLLMLIMHAALSLNIQIAREYIRIMITIKVTVFYRGSGGAGQSEEHKSHTVEFEPCHRAGIRITIMGPVIQYHYTVPQCQANTVPL